VQAQVAQSYFSLRALDAERAIVEDTGPAYADTLNLLERRYRAGDVAELEVARVRGEAAATQAEALALERQRERLEHAIAVLVGAPATTLSVARADWTSRAPIVPAGVPSTVLARRPDVAAAQASMNAALARVGVAQAAWFPSLSLTANGGVASPELSDLFKSASKAWGIGALLSLPIFDGGRLRGQLRGAEAEYAQAVASYDQAVVQALQEVADAAASRRSLGGQLARTRAAVDAAREAWRIQHERYEGGLATYLDVLNAEDTLLANLRTQSDLQSRSFSLDVALVRALGGGYSAASI